MFKYLALFLLLMAFLVFFPLVWRWRWRRATNKNLCQFVFQAKLRWLYAMQMQWDLLLRREWDLSSLSELELELSSSLELDFFRSFLWLLWLSELFELAWSTDLAADVLDRKSEFDFEWRSSERSWRLSDRDGPPASGLSAISKYFFLPPIIARKNSKQTGQPCFVASESSVVRSHS